MVMAAQFESLREPFIIIFSVPFAMVGALWAFVVTGQSLSLLSFIGVIMLVGEDLGLHAYTRWVRVHGVGTHSPPHLDTHVWPGTNHVLALVVAVDQVSALLERLRGIKSSAAQEGLRAFVLPVEDGV